jgi:hypothetical protein
MEKIDIKDLIQNPPKDKQKEMWKTVKKIIKKIKK